MKKFVSLFNTTEYTFLDSLIRVEDLVVRSSQAGLPAVVLSDKDSMFGLGVFLESCQKVNIKPIVGVDLGVGMYRFILLAKNHAGFVKINELILQKSQGNEIEPEQINDPNIFVLDHPTKGYFALTGHNGYIAGSNYFVHSEDATIHNAIYLRENKIMNVEDNETLNILQKLGDHPTTTQTHNYFDDLSINSVLIDRIHNIIEQCNFELPPKKLNLAIFNDNDSKTNEKLFLELIHKGIKRVFNELPKDKDVWYSRLKMEFDTIKKLGFIDYFLIIQDLVQWAKERNISVGPGRGSGAGSLIAYLLNITTINPLKYDLLFERFLNPERVSWPDIDIDIQDDRRGEVFDYVVNKYGYQKTALITTFQKILAKTAIRDTGRILGISLVELNQISAAIGECKTLDEALKTNLKFQLLIEKYPLLLHHALKIEGLPRQVGYHPAGIIISQYNISKYSPVSQSNIGTQQTQLTMEYIESFGMLKIDLLGLKTLTELQYIEQDLPTKYHFENILANDPYKKLLNDPKTFERLNHGLTQGIFQLESDGMKKTISKVKINTFHDLYAIISLFRPGPERYISNYAENKENPENIQKIHPKYDAILESTYGIMVYQEQIMQIAQQVAGMSFANADFLRRAISKKNEDEIKKYKDEFYRGALKNGLNQSQIQLVFSNIERFAQYGFNKSHAVSYAFLTMKMAYYKTYFPMHFYSALITNMRGDQKKISDYVSEMRRLNINVFSPEIIHSSSQCIVKNNSMYLPFDLIKGFGSEGVNKIIKCKEENSDFGANLNDTLLQLKFAGLGDSALITLIKANVFRNFGHIKFIENAFKTLQDCYKLVSNLDWQSARQKLNSMGYLTLQHDEVSRDINYEAQSEAQLLGSIYNAFLTSPYEQDYVYKLNNIPVGQTVYVPVQLGARKILRGKSYFVMELVDSSGQITVFPKDSEMDKYSPIRVGEVFEAALKRTQRSIKLVDYKFINK
ncbi:DNA polymerase III alpha subunit [Mycoplasmopsis californica HAZ160_1]|uniref:DNA-directed DNA polymerase n=1 Tax=Mycoplasmopsis californica HAZ160_1 TaxID=1397850 RepID=A0AAT9F7C9_9BACT|nr:DNA polymerase III subunit alpha [Mycoplasmopsis californica]BAP00796.1 DNA polymerase III alpha subunit [Mycoplasmopsis californica HAZ160_1]BBG40649.1 DNA polymerase III alpha subunit [Mycoplasmopsis californica]BBG41244.1 DNA polymerase III alpha subunit [Mycoplasmopsis californica]BBG41837.1 DNA polymerase III alpha subunit [Mycoplasmopsis californica]BBG42432.1 DNA polymerase III alpha subunit [Mycoplasmopsis californica]